MKNMKVRKKLTGSFAIVLLLLIIAVVISLYTFAETKRQINYFYSEPYEVKEKAATVKENFEAMQKYTFRAIASTDPTITEASITSAKECDTLIKEALPVIEEFLDDQQLADEIESYMTKLEEHWGIVLGLVGEGKNTEASAYMEEKTMPEIERASECLAAISSSTNQKGETLLKQIDASEVRAMIFMLVLGIIGVIASVILSVSLGRNISRPLEELKAAANEMAEGNLGVSISYKSKDEIGQVAESMQNMIYTLNAYITDIRRAMALMAGGDLRIVPEVEFKGDFTNLKDSIVSVVFSLNDALEEIHDASVQVDIGSDQVAAGATILSQGSTEQASAAMQLAARIDDVSVHVKENADSVKNASINAELIGKEMAQSNEKMQRMNHAMKAISENSSEIGKIIKTIEDIAFQTNILALNAAVEAARAGTAGKGFAVVAQEVRNLATKSAEASKNTSALIEASILAVGEGTKIAEDTAEELNAISADVNNIVKEIEAISRTSGEQAAAIAEVTGGIDQISAVIQTNSATAQESAAASEELSAQAQVLSNLVERFTLIEKGVKDKGNPISQPKQQRKPAESIDLRKPDMIQKY